MPLVMFWGTNTRPTGQASGQFLCPVCRSEQYVEHVEATRWYAGLILIVPYWFTRPLGPHFQCGKCRYLFPEAALMPVISQEEADEAVPQEDLLQQIREDLEMGTSVEETKRLLLEMGTDGEVAIKLVKTAAAGRTKRCGQCGLNFLDSLAACARCGRTL